MDFFFLFFLEKIRGGFSVGGKWNGNGGFWGVFFFKKMDVKQKKTLG